MDWCSSGRRARGEAWDFASYESRTEVRCACSCAAPRSALCSTACDSPPACLTRPQQVSVQVAPGAPPVPLLVDAVRLEGSAASPLRSRMGRAHVVGVLVLTGPRRVTWHPGMLNAVCVCCHDGTRADAPCARRRVAAHAAALLRDLEAFTPRCFSRARASAGVPGGEGEGDAAPPPFFFAAGCALECAGGGAVVRIAAERADDAYAWVRAALAPLHAQLGGAPYRL